MSTDSDMEKRITALEAKIELLTKGKKVTREKTTRKPSEYNLFMKERIESLKSSQPGMTHKERFSKAVELWKDRKSSA